MSKRTLTILSAVALVCLLSTHSAFATCKIEVFCESSCSLQLTCPNGCQLSCSNNPNPFTVECSGSTCDSGSDWVRCDNGPYEYCLFYQCTQTSNSVQCNPNQVSYCPESGGGCAES
jgi:hypothetical protein